MQNKREFIREKLAKFSLSQVWLVNELEEQGVITEKCELSSALKGTRRGPKILKIIDLSVEILKRYEERYKRCQ